MNWESKYLNKVICADCLEVMKELPAKCIDLIDDDPPYNFVSEGGGFAKKRGYIKRVNDSFGTDFKPELYLDESKRIMKIYNAYWWCSKNLVKNYIDWAIKNGFYYNILAWHKLNPIPLNNNTFFPDTEYCIYIKETGAHFTKGLDHKYYKKYWLTGIVKNKNHPTVKPLKIIHTNIMVSSKEGDIVLDGFMGYGTTGLACKQTNRNYIGIEINPEYVRLANCRIHNEAGLF